MVRFENVGLRYGLGPEVLRDLTFRIEPHSFQFLTGPSGAGKTSLLRLLFLSLKPTRGLITQFGHDVATLSRDAVATLRRRIGIVFQDFRLLDHMTTYENVSLPLRVMGRPEESYREEVIELLSWVGLGERMWALPPVLSGGEKQRAAIARVIATARFTLVSRSRPGAGIIWIVISRAMSDCHSPAAFVTRTAAPVVNDTRNVMIATTATRARPEIELRGTSAVPNRGWSSFGSRSCIVKSMRASLIAGLSRKYAVGRHAARGAWHRTGPSARCRASR